MSARRSPPSDHLLLIAATTILVLTAQRYFQSNPRRKSDPPANLAVARRDNFADEISQPGHGRLSSTPLQIPWAGWRDILWRTYVRSGEDRLLAIAAGVVFFGLLAVFPAITALVSCYGLFADPSTIGANLQTLALMLPEGSFQIVQDQIARVLDKGEYRAGRDVPVRPRARDLERQCRRQGRDRRPQRRLRGAGKAQLHSIEPALAGVHVRRDRRLAADGRRGGGVSAGARSPRPCRRKAGSSSAWRDGRCCS